MISTRRKNLFVIMLWCISGIFVFSSQADGFECSPEPTDDLIQYGDTVTCTIDPIGDTDKFRFQGSNGDTVAVQAARQSGGNPCIQLFDPDGMIIAGTCGGSTARIDADLDQTGIHSILVFEWSNDTTMDYGLSYQCIGVCPPICSPFADVCKGNWAYDSIVAIYEEGITQGCSKNPLKYCPKIDVTREQMAAFIVRAVEGEPPANYCDTGSPFSDVPSTSVFCKYIKRLSELGITQGCGGDKFCPKTIVTREQMAAFLVRAVEGEPPPNYCDTGSPFSDVPSTSVFCKYIKRLSELEITKGCGGDKFCPKNNVKRDQMAVFLDRAFLEMD